MAENTRQTGVKHRSSVSRVVPAIPRALVSKTRRDPAATNNHPAPRHVDPPPAVLKADEVSETTTQTTANSSLASGEKHDAIPGVGGPANARSDTAKLNGVTLAEPLDSNGKALEGETLSSSPSRPDSLTKASDQPQSSAATSLHSSNPASTNPTSLPPGDGRKPPGLHQTRPSANSIVFGGHQPVNPSFNPHGHNSQYSDPHIGYRPTELQHQHVAPFPQQQHQQQQREHFTAGGLNGSSLPFYPTNARQQSSPPRRAKDFNPQFRYPPPAARGMPSNPVRQPDNAAGAVLGEQPKAIHPDLMASKAPLTDGQSQGYPAEYAPALLPYNNETNNQHVPNPVFLGPLPRDLQANMDLSASTNLAQYLCGQFGNFEFADHLVRLSHSAMLFPPAQLSGHAVILARSRKLRSLMAMQSQSQAYRQTPLKNLLVVVSDKFLTNETALSKAMMRLYADPLPSAQYVTGLVSPMSRDGSLATETMRFALSFAAAGHFLQIDEIVSHGLDLAAKFISWDNVDRALAFGLDGGLGVSWSRGETVDEDLYSGSAADEHQASSPTSTPTYGFYSDRLLHSVVEFMIKSCESGFQFWAGAPQLLGVARFPLISEQHRQSRSGSRLSKIRFGDMSLEEEEEEPQQQASPQSGTFSSTLVSLPFPMLQYVLEHPGLSERLGGAQVARVTQGVIEERERRRQKAAAARGTMEAGSRGDEKAWNNVKWAEMVEEDGQSPSGVRVLRRWAGHETSKSAGSGRG